MKDIIFLNTLRSLWRTKNRFFSILAIIALGCGFFAGVRSTCPDMKYTAKVYFNEYNLSDIHIISNVGFDDEDIAKISDVDGVSGVQKGYYADLFAKNPEGSDIIVKAMSLDPDNQTQNLPVLIEGRLPESADECVVEQSAHSPEYFKIGNEITLSTNDDTRDLGDILVRDTYKIVGIVKSPLYISFERGNTQIGNGVVSAFCILPDEAFSYSAYTDVYLTLEDSRDFEPFSEEYYGMLGGFTEEFKKIGENLAPERAKRAVEEELTELERAKVDFEKAEADLKKGKEKLETSRSDYNEALDVLNSEEAKLSEAKMRYADSLAEYERFKTEYEEEAAKAQSKIDEAEAEIEASEREYNMMLSQYNEALSQYEASLSELEEAEAQFKYAPGLAEVRLKLQNIKAELDGKKAELDNAKAEIDKAKMEVSAAKEELVSGKNRLDNVKAELDHAAVVISEGEEKIASAREELVYAGERIDSAQAEIYDGEARLSKAELDIADGETKINDAITGAKWYVYDRTGFVDYEGYGENADRIAAIASVFPVFFIIVALLVCLTTMTRMVEEQRTQIGVMKALGFSSGRIAMQYVIYAASASIIGGFIGLAVGFWLFPTVIINTYGMLYNTPGAITSFKWDLGLICIGVSVVCTSLSALFACMRELSQRPAALLRQKPPKSGRRVFLERTPVWKHMSFTKKVTARNLFRYKGRVLMTIIGIAGCSALILAGFMLKYSISSIVDKQFGEVFIHDATMLVDEGVTDEQRIEIEDALLKSDYVSESLKVMEKSMSVSSGFRDYDAYVFVPCGGEELGAYVDLHDRISREPFYLSEGIVISEKLSRLLGVSKGDTVTVGEMETARDFVVSGICENYAYNYVFMSKDAYLTAYRTAPSYNAYLINTVNSDMNETISEDMLSYDGVLGLSYNDDTRSHFNDIMGSLNYIVYVIILSAGLLAFVVLYNLTNINVNERVRELATIKVLGFTDLETAQYIYRENMISTFIGTALGLIGGVFLGRFVVRTAEVEMVMFAPDIAPWCFVSAACLTIVFALLVNFALYFRLKKINMATSLSAME